MSENHRNDKYNDRLDVNLKSDYLSLEFIQEKVKYVWFWEKNR